jgi:hypothetical protein
MGSYPSSNVPIGAYWRQSTFPAITTPLNMSTIGSGLGDYFQPLVLSNVKPAGIGPGDPYAVRIDLSVTIPTATGEFVGNTGVGTSYFTWANEPNSYLYFVNNTSQSTSNIVASQLGLAGSNQTTAFTVPAASQNISLPASGNLTIYGELVGDASINIVFGNSSNALVTSAEPSTLIQMNNGRITWNYAYNTTTIENSLNDTSTRNLYYYGSLNSVSDPRVKENIELADLDQCRDIVDAVPLYTYSMRPEYCSTFGVPATQRLGIMATELEEAFTHSVRETTVQGVTLKMVDTQQLEMAHLGTTKRLIQELREIKAYLSNL